MGQGSLNQTQRSLIRLFLLDVLSLGTSVSDFWRQNCSWAITLSNIVTYHTYMWFLGVQTLVFTFACQVFKLQAISLAPNSLYACCCYIWVSHFFLELTESARLTDLKWLVFASPGRVTSEYSWKSSVDQALSIILMPAQWAHHWLLSYLPIK